MHATMPRRTTKAKRAAPPRKGGRPLYTDEIVKRAKTMDANKTFRARARRD